MACKEPESDSATRQEEANFIHNTLEYFERFFMKLGPREVSLSEETLKRLTDFKTKMQPYLVPATDGPDKTPGTVFNGLASNEATGAIPKVRPVAERTSVAETSASSEVDSDASKTSSSSSEASETPKPMRRKCLRKRHRQLDRWTEMLEKLDSRKVPEIRKFDETLGQSLRIYLEEFETYCRNTFKGNVNLWKDELEKHLQGKTLQVCKSLHDINDTYESLKEKLCTWYEETKDMRKEKSKMTFGRARCENGESMYLYSTRLEKLFKQAYPAKKITTSQTLRDKFVRSVPKRFRQIINGQIMTHKLRDSTITWKEIQKCARHFDLEEEKDNESDVIGDDMVVSVGQRKKSRDAVTQCESNSYAFAASRYVPPRHSSYRHNREVPAPRDHRIQIENQRRQSCARSPWYADLQQHPSRSGDMSCDYCGRMGHGYSQCRFRLGQCLLCGDGNHFIRDCPKNLRSRNTTQLRVRSQSQPPQPTASECSSGHELPTKRAESQLNLRAPVQLR